MELPVFRALLSLTGQEAVRAAMKLEPREVDFLAHFSRLSHQFPPEMARGALEIAILRGEARGKFPFAEEMYFHREGLEQATAYEVSAYRAERFRSFDFCIDLGCSIGGDTLALAAHLPTLGIDQDELRLLMARANVKALGRRASFARANLNDPLPFQPRAGVALFMDPARRTAGRRVYSVDQYQPPLSIIQSWLEDFPSLGVKISPGVKLDEISEYQAEVEFISLRGELKEAVLWFGSLKSTRRRATLLPGAHSLAFEEEPDLPVSEPRLYIYEPDPAVLRAGMVRSLGQMLEAAQLDPEIAYLTADQIMPTPFARAWAVMDWFPFQLKRLRSYLREHSVGQVVVKKRGSPLQPEALIRDLRLKGDQERVIFLTQLHGRPIVIVCQPLS